MSYTPSTDFLALARQSANSVALARMPGLDFAVSALSRAGLFYVYEGQTAPTANQVTTVWFQPAQPSWTAEGKTWLWNVDTDTYELATPALWSALLLPAGFNTEGQPLVFNTVDDVRVAVVPRLVQSLLVIRYATGYPLSLAVYVPGVSAGPMAFRDAGGRWWQLDLTGDKHNVLWFAAKGVFSTVPEFDDTPAFQAYASFVPLLNVPDGAFKLTSSVNLKGEGAGVVGAGRGRTKIIISSTTASAFVLAAVAQPRISGMQIRRDPATPATAGACGLDVSQGTAGQGVLDDILLDGHYIGLLLGTTDSGRLTNTTVQNSVLDGIVMTPAGSSGTLQWQIDNVLSVQNGRHGLRILSTSAVAQLTMGQIRALQTFANSGHGISAEGLPTAPIQALRIFSGFYGNDGDDEIWLDTYNTTDNSHLIEGVYVEAAGTDVTGPGLITPASHVGRGLFATANNRFITLNNSVIKTNSQEGIKSSALQIMVNGCSLLDNGLAAPNTYAGVHIAAGSVSFLGGRSSDTVFGLSQRYGIILAAGTDNHLIDDVDLRNYFTAPIQNLSTGLNNRIVNNLGYNPVGQSNPAPGASPWTYRAGPTPETIYLTGGTVSVITLQPSGFSIVANAATTSIPLSPNEQITVLYTVAPTVVRSIH